MSLAPAEALHLYKKMLRIRLFEKRLEYLFTRGLIHGTAHLYLGQEAMAAGVCAALRQDDFVTSTHRGHGHALAKGLPMGRFLAELQGKTDGFCGGRGGTQHVISMDNNFIANGVTGGTAVTGTGIALAFKMQKRSKIVASFVGDGAINEGHFHEALNIASVWRLPIVYVCENNLYAMSTHTRETMVIQDISRRTESYGMAAFCIDGNDVEIVKETMQKAVSLAREGNGPVFIEGKTYRQSGHSKNDQFLYRTREEEEEWRKKDPIRLYEKRLGDVYNIAQEQLDGILQEVEREIEEAVAFAAQSPIPSAETALEFI